MTYSKGYTKEDHKIATRMSRLRTKIREHRATQLEKAELADYERKKGKRARPVEPEAPSPPSNTVSSPAPASQPPESPETPQVQSTLPGAEGTFVPPPLSVGGAAPSSPTGEPPPSSSAPPPSAQSATNSAPKQGPAMSKEEAAASGEMIANVCTQIATEFNSFNLKHGASGFDPASPFFKMLHFSIKRLATKYGASIDEDQYDALVIVGSGAFIGWNSYKVYRKQEQEKVVEMKPAAAPKAEEKVDNGSQQRTSPIPGAIGGPVDRAARTVFSGGPGDSIPSRGFTGRRDFDPNGPY